MNGISENSDEDDEIIGEFLRESNEHLDYLDNQFVAIEADPNDKKVLSAIFRSMHTIKGGAGMLQFGKLEKLAHTAESLLSHLRDGKLSLTSDMTNSLLKTVDAIRAILQTIAETNHDGDEAFVELINELSELQHQENTPKVEVTPAIAEKTENEQPENKTVSEATTPTPIEIPKTATATDNTLNQLREDTTIRVDVHLLDNLMNLVGELVLARNNATQLVQRNEDSALQTSISQISQITTELREGIMKTRMQPIEHIWSKFPRVVRDLAKSCNKNIRLVMNGKNTELDKSLIEAIRDPMTHLIRNAVDHGIESTEERIQKGKDPEGQVTLNAYHKGGQVNIEINDDGGGIEPNKIANKAVEKGLITEDQKKQMDRQALLNLIFLPGFSTASVVTNVSGRGVGMDVVKTNLEKIGGTIEIVSTPNEGTSFKLKIPLTLAIVPALLIESNGCHFAIPQVNIVELVKLNPRDPNNRIERFLEIPVYRLREKLLQVIHLNQILAGDENSKFEDFENTQTHLHMVICEVNNKSFAIVVDEIIDSQEIVVKPLSKRLKNIVIYSGCTIMGNGNVAIILDIFNLAHSANVIGNHNDKLINNELQQNMKHNDIISTKNTFVLAQTHGDRTFAIELAKIARFEEFDPNLIVWSSGSASIPYRGDIIQLIFIAGSVYHNAESSLQQNEQGKIQAVIYNKNDLTFGIVVDTIIDIIETDAKVQKSGKRSGISGSMLIDNHVIDLICLEDIEAELTSCHL